MPVHKLLVTGAAGQLGHDLVEELSSDFSVIGMDRTEMDVTDSMIVSERLKDLCPDIVIHAAAFAEVDGCELDPSRASLVNVNGTSNLANACRDMNIKLLLYSTDFVFDGTNDSPYTENDLPNPINIYGRSKLEAEKIVASTVKDHLILRISWLYAKRSRNFLRTLTELWQKQLRAKANGEEVVPFKLVKDQIGNPTWTKDVARQTSKLISEQVTGLFHVVSQGFCSRQELAEEIFSQLDWSPKYELCSSNDFPQTAKRPLNTTLDTGKLEATGLSIMPHWRQSLTSFLDKHGKELSHAM